MTWLLKNELRDKSINGEGKSEGLEQEGGGKEYGMVAEQKKKEHL